MEYISLSPSLKLTNAIFSPSGDQLGSKSFASSSVNLVWSLPSSLMVYISWLPSLSLLKAICPFGPGNVPAHALWLIGITERLGSNSMIAETAKRKATLAGTGEPTALQYLCAYH